MKSPEGYFYPNTEALIVGLPYLFIYIVSETGSYSRLQTHSIDVSDCYLIQCYLGAFNYAP